MNGLPAVKTKQWRGMRLATQQTNRIWSSRTVQKIQKWKINYAKNRQPTVSPDLPAPCFSPSLTPQPHPYHTTRRSSLYFINFCTCRDRDAAHCLGVAWRNLLSCTLLACFQPSSFFDLYISSLLLPSSTSPSIVKQSPPPPPIPPIKSSIISISCQSSPCYPCKISYFISHLVLCLSCLLLISLGCHSVTLTVSSSHDMFCPRPFFFLWLLSECP